MFADKSVPWEALMTAIQDIKMKYQKDPIFFFKKNVILCCFKEQEITRRVEEVRLGCPNI